MKRHILLSAACAACLAPLSIAAPLPASGPASEPASAPATAPGALAEAMKIYVVEVKGLVQVRLREGEAWKPAKVGMELDQGAEFRTGPRSSVTCQIPPDQTLVLDRLGTVRIDEAIRSGTKIKTDMVMKYGRTHYDIEAAGAEHQSTIRSPGSTLAVRGTFVSLYDQPPFTPVAESIHGQAAFRNAHRELRFGGTTPMKVAADKNSVADTALAQSVVDPTSGQTRTKSEQQYIGDQTSKGALLSFDSTSGIPVIRDGPPPLTDAQLLAAAPFLPGKLDIVLRWQGDANINLVVVDTASSNVGELFTLAGQAKPATEFLYPGFGLNHGAAGGTIPYDNQGGPNGGTEIAYWKNSFPRGLYGIEALHVSGGPSLISLNVFLNGKPLDNLVGFKVDTQGNVVDANGNVLTDAFSPDVVIIKNSQITRPLNAPTKHPPGFGANAGFVAVQSIIPSDPVFDSGVPVEPPISFPPPASGKGGKTHADASAKATRQESSPAVNAPVGPVAPVQQPRDPTRQTPRPR